MDSYMQLYKNSVKDLWHNQTIFWSTALVTFIYVIIYGIAMIPLIFNELSMLKNGTYALQSTPEFNSWGLALFINLLTLLFTIFVTGALYGSFTKTINKQKVGINQYFTLGIKNFAKIGLYTLFNLVLSLPYTILYLIAPYLMQNNNNFSTIILYIILYPIVIVYLVWISYKMFFAIPHIVSGHSVKESIIFSYKNSKNGNHQLRAFWSQVGIITLILLVCSLVLLLSIPLMMVLIGFPLMIATGVVYGFLLTCIPLFIMKCYSLNPSKTTK